MCLILLAYEVHPRYRLIVAANRDEFYDRPTQGATFWEDAPHVLAGRDLKQGGTWLAVTRRGRLGAVTNYRDPAAVRSRVRSRGMLVARFVLGKTPARAYLERVAQEKDAYNPFNLLVGDDTGLYWFSNRCHGIHAVSRGIHALCNHLLDTPWPKVRRGRHLFSEAIAGQGKPLEERLLSLLTDCRRPPDAELPDTGVGKPWERILSPIFIKSPAYGTRSSTVVLMEREGRIVFVEQTFYPGSVPIQHGPLRRFVLEKGDPEVKL